MAVYSLETVPSTHLFLLLNVTVSFYTLRLILAVRVL